MICFRDMTFCTYHTSCLNPCSRALTEEVRLAAKKWWGNGNAPICMFSREPECCDKLENHVGEVLQFEYHSDTTGWTYDEDIITPALIESASEFRHMKILRDDT